LIGAPAAGPPKFARTLVENHAFVNCREGAEMSDLEDLSAKAARLWLEFMQAQAKAAAAAAQNLPEVTRSLAEAGLPLAAEVNRWMQGAFPAPAESREVQAEPKEDAPTPVSQVVAAPGPQAEPGAPRVRVNHRRLKIRKSLSRRRARRA
jgi:hypothetical protein